jgi:hypothetical protein
VSGPGEADLQEQLGRLERLIREMEDGPESSARARARQIVQATLDLHGGALTRLLDIVTASGPLGRSLIQAFADDPLVAGMLLLHELHPLGLEARVRDAIARLAPTLRGHGIDVTLTAIVAGAVRLRIERAAGRGAVPAAVRSRVEEAILAAAPDAASVEIEESPVVAFIPLEQVRLRSRTPQGPRT